MHSFEVHSNESACRKRSVLGWNKSLPGSFIIHPNPLFCYKDLSQDTTKKLKLASITPQEGATVRCIISASPLKGKEEYIIILLSLYTQNPDSPLYPKDLPPKPSSYTPSIPYLSPKISFLNISNWSNKTPPHPTWTQCTHYGFFWNLHICLNISFKIIDNVPMETQYWINILCQDVMTKTISRLVDKKTIKARHGPQCRFHTTTG